MSERNTSCKSSEDTGKLTCSGIWGGIRNLERDIKAGAVFASLFSSSCDGGKGGDVYYFGVCRGDTITRVAIADVIGHGQAVSDVSQRIYGALTTHMCDPDSAAILAEVNRLTNARDEREMTTAAVIAYDANKAAFDVSYAGHPPVFFKRASGNHWTLIDADDAHAEEGGWATNIPLAVTPDALYSRFVIPASSGDRLFIYTDGVTEAPNASGELFGRERLEAVLNANADAGLSGLKSAALQALRSYTDRALTHDDVTFIAMEVR